MSELENETTFGEMKFSAKIEDGIELSRKIARLFQQEKVHPAMGVAAIGLLLGGVAHCSDSPEDVIHHCMKVAEIALEAKRTGKPLVKQTVN